MAKSMQSRIILGALIALAPFSAIAQNIYTVYRADPRPPDVVFQHGFTTPGTNVNVMSHVLMGSCNNLDPLTDTAWVSTSASMEQARRFAAARLDAIHHEGWSETMWMYTIRPDSTYVSVPLLLRQVTDLAEAGERGYSREFAYTLNNVMATSSIGTLEEVVTPHIVNVNIVEARPYWYSNGDIIDGPPYTNEHFIHADTHASTDVPGNVHMLVPPNFSRLFSRQASCALSCDQARSWIDGGGESSPLCRMWNGGISIPLFRSLF